MMPNSTPPVGRDRPFPWHCTNCHSVEVFPNVTDYTTDVKHDGHAYTIRIADLAIPTCRKCGELVFTAGADDRIMSALRDLAGLLTPQEIQDRRRQLVLSPQGLAEQLGVPTETLCRWESGALIQPRTVDNRLREIFDAEKKRQHSARQF